MDFLFYFISFLILGFAILVVKVKNILHAALALIACFFATAALYIILNAEFVGVVQVLVYIGGIVIFMLYAILLTTEPGQKFIGNRKSYHLSGMVIAFLVFLFVFYFSFVLFPFETKVGTSFGDLKDIGRLLLSNKKGSFLFPFELVSLLLLTAMIGAVVIARQDKDNTNKVTADKDKL